MQRASETGAEGNSRLTSSTGMVLLVLLAVEGVTVLRVRQLITLHIYLGVLLLGPVILKTFTTGYRFVRYYTGSAPYVQKGPPHPILRVLGPLVIVSSFALLGTGVALIFSGGHGGLLLTAHQVSFFAWFAVMTVHVLGHLREAVGSAAAEIRAGAVRGRAGLRALALVTALVGGVALASALYPSATAWTSHHDHRPPQDAASHGS